MTQTVLAAIGRAAHWLFWPAIAVGLLLSRRTRVLIVDGDEIVVVLGWLGNGKWELPGGGRHRGESALDGARREVLEEIGVDIPASNLQCLGSFRAPLKTAPYRYELFKTSLARDTPLIRQAREIRAIAWMPCRDLTPQSANKDVLQALGQLAD